MVFYHKGLWVCKTPLSFVACDRKAAILRVQIWSAHESDVVGLRCDHPGACTSWFQRVVCGPKSVFCQRFMVSGLHCFSEGVSKLLSWYPLLRTRATSFVG